MSAEPRTITVPTEDYGDVTLPEPDWCIGHADEQEHVGYRVDISHGGPDVELVFWGEALTYACLTQSPFAEQAPRTIGVSVGLLKRTLTAVELYELAAAVDGYADRLRDLADKLDQLTDGGDS
ncbi:hypothetical protein [Streptomyces sp. NPDC047024]|uniref:DUF6907 domain-containing protein n=1 Tax=Streptomyces sp. NPDC047024 TaxID=3155476 RepID=UPI0033E888FB